MKLKTITKQDLESLLENIFKMWGIATVVISISQLIEIYYVGMDFESCIPYIMTLMFVFMGATILSVISIGLYLCQEDKANDVSDTAESICC